jgi:hypothetical protein
VIQRTYLDTIETVWRCVGASQFLSRDLPPDFNHRDLRRCVSKGYIVVTNRKTDVQNSGGKARANTYQISNAIVDDCIRRFGEVSSEI